MSPSHSVPIIPLSYKTPEEEFEEMMLLNEKLNKAIATIENRDPVVIIFKILTLLFGIGSIFLLCLNVSR